MSIHLIIIAVDYIIMSSNTKYLQKRNYFCLHCIIRYSIEIISFIRLEIIIRVLSLVWIQSDLFYLSRIFIYQEYDTYSLST